jgi:ATP diphosphatase
MERHWQGAKAVEKSLPPPATLPRAPLATLRFTVPDVAAQRVFWDGVAPLLGWRVERGGREEARYGDGAHRLVFLGGTGAGAARGSSLAFTAPSERSVERLRASLEAAAPGAVVEAGPGRVVFVDPAGLHWEYGTGAD